MLAAFLRPFKGSSSRVEDQPDLEQDVAFRPSIAEYRRHLHATADFTEADDDDEESNDGEQSRVPRGGRPEVDEDGLAGSAGLLPLFSANHLDSLPIYSVTHAIRIIVQARTETTLSWDQLRSPQISQFLVKPMLQQIRNQHFSQGTLYALMANCLQFEKEAQQYPATAGTSGTRARVCELLAIKLLKEYTTRELIDALCYDFDPLQGVSGSQSPLDPGGSRPKSAAERTSTLEVAIRASAEHFLSHPLVVQQLEAIWNGAISIFPTREEPRPQASSASAVGSDQSRRQSTIRTPLLGDQRPKEDSARVQAFTAGRRAVALYDPRTASPFKLSRLRVPRYRQLFSTFSLVILVGLFLAVLAQRSSKITTLELLFWFWSAGFMLDEIVGFNEQGFSFYVMNFWNIFDLGILVLLIVYYCMRIYGVFLLDPHKWNQNAYDVLAVNAILLLPRIFGVLEHNRYFSKLLIALRLLAIDLAAVFVLIMICCSGFFVFFAFSKNADDPAELAYKMFQMLMGFTPSAWERWPSYNWMGKALMGLFLVICHFIILSLLITVLGNSFMSIASRTSQEYHFTFAINTISMVKSDGLFSYVAPGNIFAWTLMPLRYCMSSEHYIWINRTVIKATHFPLLVCIYFYEKLFLAPDVYEATDLVDRPRRGRRYGFSDPASRSAFFSPSIRVREESVVGYQKDRALEEVFRRAPDVRRQRQNDRRKTQTAIRTWMDQQEGGYTSPRNYSTIDTRIAGDWNRRTSINPERPSRVPRNYSDIKSAASDPADLISEAPYPVPQEMMFNDGVARRDYAVETKDHTDGDADGDDELVTNDEDEGDDATNNMDAVEQAIEEDYFTTPVATRFTNAELSSLDSPRPPTSRRVPLHTRTLSTNTILYAPEDDPRPYSDSSASAFPINRPFFRPLSTRHTPVATPIIRTGAGDGRRSPRRLLYLAASRPRSMIQPGDTSMSRTASTNPPAAGLTLDIPTATASRHKPPTRRRSLADLDVTSADDDGNDDNDTLSARSVDHASRMNKLVLAKMKSLEESLGDMVREMRVLRKSVPNTAHNSDEGGAEANNGGGSGSGGGSKSWGRAWGRQHGHHQHHHHQQQQHQQYHHQQRGRTFPASDPSSVSGGQALIEVAVGHGHAYGRDRLKKGGGKVLPKRIPPRRAQGVWRSPRGEGESGGGAAGLVVTSRGGLKDASGRTAKGKEREVGVGSGSGEAGGAGGESPGSDELGGVSGKGISL
ncbi:hypothetical protein VTI74DRAFT_2959 [Chaetomium olivicolor]